MEDILLKLIAPVAHHLDGLWEQDVVDFSQISLGLIRLQQISHQIGQVYQTSSPFDVGRHRMMIAAPPGSQHLLGLSIIAELFRKDGWEVVVEIADTQSALLHTAGKEWFDLIGLSVCLSDQLPLLPELVSQLKQLSKHRNVPIMLGGSAFLNSDIQGLEFGADAILEDATDAVLLGNLLVEAHCNGYII
jgi:methylmalonyl-CoA mutase cobalamin-binding domain/chain